MGGDWIEARPARGRTICKSGCQTSPGLRVFSRCESGDHPRSLLIEHIPVERAVLNGFKQVGLRDVPGPGQIGDGAGHLKDAVVGAGGERELLHGLLQQIAQRGAEGAVGLDIGREHPGIGGQAGAAEAHQLILPGLFDALPDGGGGFTGPVTAQLGDGEGRSLDVQVDAVKQRAADPGAVALNLRRRAAAFVFWVTQITARAGAGLLGYCRSLCDHANRILLLPCVIGRTNKGRWPRTSASIGEGILQEKRVYLGREHDVYRAR